MRVVTILLLTAATSLCAEYPGAEWAPHSRTGWSEPLLKGVRDYAKTRQTAAVMIVQGGRVVDQWGDLALKVETRSVRKSFLSALYGIHVAEGRIDLAKTMGDLGIDDKDPSLTKVEKQATILDLLRARSGVYHEIGRESPWMKASRPPRSSHVPGEFYYYNNWDFNVLGTIFEKLTGTKIFEEFERRIARPIGMQDFSVRDGHYETSPESMHRHYIFSVTARDMARFGYLYLRAGRWGDQQIVPSDWVERSTTPYSSGLRSDLIPFGGYGFMWWTSDWGYSALGVGGHVIAVIPRKDLVIVHRVDNNPPRTDSVPYWDIDTMIRMVIAAAAAK
jgi:CubicO group peptidase (beta-lactamase class C family)